MNSRDTTVAIFRLTDSQPVVFLLPDDTDERSAAALAGLLAEKNVPFHIFADEYDEGLLPFENYILDDIASSPSPPHLVIDCSTTPIPTPNPFLMDAMAAYPNLTLLSSTPNFTATQLSALLGIPNIARVNFLPGFFPSVKTLEFCHSLSMSREALLQTDKFLGGLGLHLEKIEDIVGFVTPRIVAMLANEAAFAVMENVSSAAEIDEAMRLGTNYPKGPLEWADEIGLDTVVMLLDALFGEYKQERYRACRLLRQYASAGWTGLQAEKGFYAY